MKNSKIIKRLSYDKAFGILTRNALEIEIEKLDSFNCCFIDLNNLKNLNQLMGYEKVNEKVFELFHEFAEYNQDGLIGRWFSGDEIIIINPNIDRIIPQLDRIGRSIGLSFKRRFYYDIKTLEELTKEIELINYLKGYR